MRNRLVRSRGSALVHKSLVCKRGRSADDVLVSRTVAPELSDSAPVHVVEGSSRMPPPDNRGRPAEQHPRVPSFSPPWLLLPTNLSLSLTFMKAIQLLASVGTSLARSLLFGNHGMSGIPRTRHCNYCLHFGGICLITEPGWITPLRFYPNLPVIDRTTVLLVKCTVVSLPFGITP